MSASRDVVLRGPVLTPESPTRARAWTDGHVRIDAAGRVTSVGPWSSDVEGPVVRTGRALILPAFVDAHVHFPQLDVRGRYGEPLLEWLERWVFPAETECADPDHAAALAERFFGALAAVGTGVAAVFASVHPTATERAFEAARDGGLRVVLGKVLMDRGAPAELLEPAAEGIRATLALAERWEGAGGGLLHTAITPRFAPTSSPELLEAAGRAAADTGLRVQTHLAEQADEVALVADRFPSAGDYLEVYERSGLVRESTILAHAIHCSDEAYRRIAKAGAAIACCPTSNAFLGSGSFPLGRASDAGVEVAVGSDVGAGPQPSVLDVLRHLAYLGRPPAEELLYRGTRGGARALGLDDVTGRLAPGLSADLIVLEPPADAAGDPLEIFAQCVFRQPETRVVTTLVAGRPVHGALPD